MLSYPSTLFSPSVGKDVNGGAQALQLIFSFPGDLSPYTDLLRADPTTARKISFSRPNFFAKKHFFFFFSPRLQGNRTCFFNFSSGRSDRDSEHGATSAPPNSAQSVGSNASSSQAAAAANQVIYLFLCESRCLKVAFFPQAHLLGRYVVNHGWDSHEGNFLVCQTRPIVQK